MHSLGGNDTVARAPARLLMLQQGGEAVTVSHTQSQALLKESIPVFSDFKRHSATAHISSGNLSGAVVRRLFHLITAAAEFDTLL